MRLLVIEDDPDLRRSLVANLREETYAVDEAEDGGEGLFMAQETDYDCIVLDGMLPVMDGWTLLATLRQEKKTPVLMLTARDGLDDRIRGLDGGADDYLVKPFDLEELLARLRALIRRSSGETLRVIEIGDVAVDLACKEIRRAGAVVAVTAREYALVEYLALKHGRVVSRTELYEHLFDADEDTLSNLLDVHVSNIRKKLGSGLIVTRRGLGYMILD
ncbi:response regulator transcription factor [Verrucomicrobiaceae bacterium 5K15]|uniref:Response regulator transcription factor n=1 Tax=Oceaniferula flava TaxID=2800421 RepID=A0AAE2SFS8_9BACT|nr:response regulator transcription factor [Oceaniferula flavus]MBK1856074.1 response regulator transcription factor [Oceaniferula flavus]MBM1137381.1 response regulator transcription factor [Oceaniferula flavus]